MLGSLVGFKVREYERQLATSFQPCVEAARSIVLKSAYAVLLAAAVMLVVHIVGWIVCRCLRIRQGPYGASTATAARRPRLYAVPADSSVQTFIHRYDNSDFGDDSDDNDCAGQTVEYASSRDRQASTVAAAAATSGNATSMSPGGRVMSTTSNVNDFKYSETNV